MAICGNVESIDLSDVINVQRAVNHTDEGILRQFVLSLTETQIRYLLSNYISHFTPYCPPPKSTKKCPSIAYVRTQRLINIKNNETDQSLFTLMQEVFVNDYFKNASNKNPISINTINTKKNKCLLLKLIPKNILSHIISFADCKDRAYWRQVSFSMYQASNDSIAKQCLSLGYYQANEIFKQEKTNPQQFYGFSRIDCQNWGWYSKKHLYLDVASNLLRNATSIDGVCSLITENEFFNVITSDPVRHHIKCINAEDDADVNKMKNLLNQCYKIEKVGITASSNLGHRCDKERTDNYINQVNQLSYLIINHSNFFIQLKHLEFNMQCDFYWNNNSEIGNSFILFNVYKFINLEILKLTLSFPNEKLFDKVKKYDKEKLMINFPNMNKDNKGILKKLKSIYIKWCFVALREETVYNWVRRRPVGQTMNCYNIEPKWGGNLDGVITSTRYWNNIIFDCVEYLLYFLPKINNYTPLDELIIDYPHWYEKIIHHFEEDDMDSLIDWHVRTLNQCSVNKVKFNKIHSNFGASVANSINNYRLRNMSELEISIDGFDRDNDIFKDCCTKLVQIMCRDTLKKMS